jgi:hypothetical protein
MTLARVITLGTTPLEIGGLAVVTSGPSKGTVVRLIEYIHSAPPGTWGRGLGPFWRVDKRLVRLHSKGKPFKTSIAQVAALRALTVR